MHIFYYDYKIFKNKSLERGYGKDVIEVIAGKVEYRVDKAGIIAVSIGKISFTCDISKIAVIFNLIFSSTRFLIVFLLRIHFLYNL